MIRTATLSTIHRATSNNTYWTRIIPNSQSKLSQKTSTLLDCRVRPRSSWTSASVQSSPHFLSSRLEEDDKKSRQKQQQRLYHDAVPRIQLPTSYPTSSSLWSSNVVRGGGVTTSLTPEALKHNMVHVPASNMRMMTSMAMIDSLFQQQQRGIVTTSTTTRNGNSNTTTKSNHLVFPNGKEFHSSHPVHSSASISSPTSNSNNNEKSKDDHENRRRKRTWREKARARVKHIREGAQASFSEFREHPRESMSSGAKSFTGMVKQYGPMFMYVHLSLYFATLGALFAGVDSGALDPVYLMSLVGNSGTEEPNNTVDLVVEWMKNHSWTENMAPVVERNPHYASLAVAWITVKFTEPIRLPITLVLTPRLAKMFGVKPKKDEETKDFSETEDKSKSDSTSKTS